LGRGSSRGALRKKTPNHKSKKPQLPALQPIKRKSEEKENRALLRGGEGGSVPWRPLTSSVFGRAPQEGKKRKRQQKKKARKRGRSIHFPACQSSKPKLHYQAMKGGKIFPFSKGKGGAEFRSSREKEGENVKPVPARGEGKTLIVQAQQKKVRRGGKGDGRTLWLW